MFVPPLPAALVNGTLIVVDSFGLSGDSLNLTLPKLPAGVHPIALTLNGDSADATLTGGVIQIWQPFTVSLEVGLDLGAGGASGGQMMGQMSYQPMPGQATEIQMPQMPVPQSPGKKKGNVTPVGMAPGSYSLGTGGGRGASARQASTPRGSKGKKKD